MAHKKIFIFKHLTTFQYLIIGGFTLVSVLFLNNSLAYDAQTTHPALTREIITFYELSTGNKFTEDQKRWVIQGSMDEDRAPRWLNHFYDPVYERGLTTEMVGINGYLAKNWAQYSSYQTINPANIGNLWSGRGPVISGSWWGDFSYEAAVKNYSEDKERESYLTLGHVLHLIEDMTVPEHTRNDPHPGGNLPSYYENWTEDNSSGLTRDLGKRIFNQGYKPVIYADLGSYFSNLATYTNAHFFSPRTINLEIYRKPKIVYEDGTFAYGIDENGEYFDLAIVTTDKSLKKNYSIKDDNPQILQEYWLRLSRQAVLNGAGVIELFLNHAEAAKKAELAKQKVSETAQLAQKGSLLGQIYNFFKSPEAPANESALTVKSEPASITPKIIKQKAEAEIEQTERKPAPVQSKPEPVIAAPDPAPTLVPNLTQNQVPKPAPAPQTTAPTASFGGGGGGTSSSPAASPAPEVPATPIFNPGDLVINEIMYNPAGTDDKHEWVELYNNSGREITLTGGTNGWKFDDGAASFHGLNEPPTNGSQGSMTVAAGGYIVLADNAATFLSDHQGFGGTVIDTVMDLKNSTSTIKAIKIISPNGAVIDETLYSNSWGGDGNSKTLERKSASGGSNDATNWAESAAPGGTPGAANNWQLSVSDIGSFSTTTLTISTSTLGRATSTNQTASTTTDFAVATSTPDIATSTIAIATSTRGEISLSTVQIASLGTDVAATTTIYVNTTWAAASGPYRLFFDGTKRPTVAAGATLTIDPGVKIIPQGGGYNAMEIQGTLNAIATSGAPIIFTSIKDADDDASTTPKTGDWLNIAFSHGSKANLDYVEFRYGGQGLERPVKEMVKAIGATVNINHSNFTNSQSIALRLVDSNGVIENSTFRDNACGISVDSLVNGDGTTDGGCAGSSGYFPAAATTTSQIRNNRFIRNRLVAVETRNGASPVLDSNIFTDNGYPIRIESSYPAITNSQIANSTISAASLTNTFLNGIAVDGYTHFRKNYTLKKDLPYILETNGPALSPYVDNGATLTIEPGAVFKIGHTFTALNVNGSLIASTTPDNPIVFTSLKDDSRGGDTNGDGSASSPQNNDWANIKFLTGSIGNFVNAIFNYGGFGFVAPPPPPSILLSDFPVFNASSTQQANQFYVPVGGGYTQYSYFKPDHNGIFGKIVVHNLTINNPVNYNFNFGIIDKAHNWQFIKSWSTAGKSINGEEYEVIVPDSVPFLANNEYAFFMQVDAVAPPLFHYYSTGANGSPTGAGAFYEAAVQPYFNPAISIDAGANVVVQ